MIRVLAALTLLCSSLSFAGGSITKEDAASDISRQDPTVGAVFNQLQLEEVGSGARSPDGRRQIPYEFAGQATNGGAFIVLVDKDDAGKLFIMIQSAGKSTAN